jgi:GTPase SAR1 family protein
VDEHFPNKDQPIILVGNKKDKFRVVSYEEGERAAVQFNVPYIECSAYSGENIEEVFLLMVREMRKK